VSKKAQIAKAAVDMVDVVDGGKRM